MKKNYFTVIIAPKNRIYRHLAFLLLMILVAYFREVNYTSNAALLFKTTYLILILVLFYANVYWQFQNFY